MSVEAIVQHRPPITKSPRSNPYINIRLAQKTKITKGFHLISPRKPSSDLPGEPLQGTPLLSREGSQVYGPCTTPRYNSEVVNVSGKYVVNPYTECEESQDEEEQGPLSLFGERLGAGGNINSVRATPLLQVRARNDNRKACVKNKPIQTPNRTSPECSSKGNMTPLTPPASPYTPGADPSFSVDGQHINCDIPSRSASSKDFNPGFIKRPRYCCGKCELRMLEHESLNIETECPFQAYQRQTKSSFCYNDDVMSHEFYSEQMIDPYVFYKSPWDTQTEHYAPFERSKSVPTTTCFDRSLIHPRNRTPDAVSSSSSASIEPLQIENQEETTYPPQKTPEEANLEDNDQISSLRTITPPSRNTEYHRNPLYAIPRMDGVKNQNENISMERIDVREYSSSITEVVESGNGQGFHWTDSWNVKETRIGSPVTSSLRHRQSPLPSGGPTAVTEKASQEIVTTISSKEDNLHQPSSSDDLHNLLQGCVNSLRNLSLKTKDASSAPENSLPSPTFFQDFRMPTDICYSAVTDKRYNRWKRTKRKSKNGRKSVRSNRSDDESTDEEKGPESKVQPAARRRQKKAPSNMAQKFENSSNDASSEQVSDMAYESLQSQPGNSPISSSNESRISPTFLYKESLGCPSSSPELDQNVPIHLTSFPALSNYHASIHVGLDNKDSHRSTPDMKASIRSTPCEDNKHASPLCSTPDPEGTGQPMPEIEPPLITQEKHDNRPASIISNGRLSSCDSFSTIRSNSRFSNSLAKDTLVRMSYSIGEKIQQSMAVVPQSFDKKDIDVFKKKESVHKPAKKIKAKEVPNSSLKYKKATALNPIYSLPDPEVVRPHLSTLTLNHLLKTMPSKSSAGSSNSNNSLPEVTKKPLPEVKSSTAMNIISPSNENQPEQKKKNFGIDRRFCLASKFPVVEARVPKYQPRPEPEVQPKPQPRQVIPRMSSLDFSPAFTFSFFELPQVHKDHNALLKRRASMIK